MKKNYIVPKTIIVRVPSVSLLLGTSGEKPTSNGFTFEVSETEYSGGDVEVE